MKNVVIIGAGPAGLTAAYKLVKETDLKPIIIEKETFVGGISRTAEHNGNRIDIGGHRFFSKDQDVVNLWEEILPVQGSDAIDDKMLGRKKPLEEDGPNPDVDEKVLLYRNRVSRILYLRKFFDYPISLKLSTIMNLGLLNTMKAGFGYLGAMVSKREEKSLEDFMINRFGKPLYEMFFKEYTYKVWGRYPKDIDASWGAQRIKGLSLMKAFIHILKKPFVAGKSDQSKVETSLIEMFRYPKKGPGQLWEAMADEIIMSGGDIRKGCNVVGLKHESGKISKLVLEMNGTHEEIEADYVMSSMPVKDLIQAIHDERDEEIDEIAKALPYRDFITVGLLVTELNIKNETDIKTVNNVVPDNWIYVQELDVKIGRIQVFNNWSPYMVKDFQNTTWIGLEYFCQENDEMWNMSETEFISFATAEAERAGILKSENVLDSVRIKVEKAYPAYFGSYSKFDRIRKYLDGFENLYCIGRNGQHRYNNMDHSMLTAIEAVKCVINGDSDKSSVWDVNTEKNYHEEKKG